MYFARAVSADWTVICAKRASEAVVKSVISSAAVPRTNGAASSFAGRNEESFSLIDDNHIVEQGLKLDWSMQDPRAGGEAVISQFRVWPFLPTTMATCGERNRNPGHRFAREYSPMGLQGKSNFRTKF